MKSNHYNYESTNHSIYGTNFVRTRNAQFLGAIDFLSSPKLGQHHNKVRGVILWVLSEIQSLELCNPLTTPFTVRTSYELEVSNFVVQLISGQDQNLGSIIIWWEESFGEFWMKSNQKTYAILQLLHLPNELLMNFKCAISRTNWFRIKPKI